MKDVVNRLRKNVQHRCPNHSACRQHEKDVNDAASYLPALRSSLAKLAKPFSKVCHDQFRLFHCCKVSTSRHLGPALNIEKALGPFARRMSNVGRKQREG